MSPSCLGELLARERRELDPARAVGPLELGEQRPQRVAAVQLVGAVGADDEHALAAEAARQEGEEGARRAVGPVEVLDHQHDGVLARRARSSRASSASKSRPGREPAPSVARGAGAPRPGSSVAARRGRPRAARRARGHHRAPAVAARRRSGRRAARPRRARRSRPRGRARPLARRGGQLVEDPGLPDPRFTRYEGERRAPRGRVGQRGLELGELRRPADHPA